MRPSDHIHCPDFPCSDVQHENFSVPGINLQPDQVRIVMICEAAPADRGDDFYATPAGLFAQTTVKAFNFAGVQAASIQDLLAEGIYCTSAVKCSKVGERLKKKTVQRCSRLLERELALFPNVKAYLLMGDTALNAFKALLERAGEGEIIPDQAIFHLRGQKLTFQGKRIQPTYLHTMQSFFTEKVKQAAVRDDIRRALDFTS
jgi:hypothetical protein